MSNSPVPNSKLPNYGGQAVIEGVMMRGKKAAAIAMRTPDGEIEIHTEPLSSLYQSRWVEIPFLRGVLGLWDALVLGTRALTISANAQTGEDEQLEGGALFLTMLTSLALAVGLFFLIPAGIGQFTEKTLGWAAWAGNVTEGLIRMIFLILYIWGIGRMEDIQRVFAYHGAEHKVINAFEHQDELVPEQVKRHSLEHPRCGTAFLLVVVVISVLLFTLLGPLGLLWKLVSRILLLPVIAGIAYEYLRFTADNLDHPVIAWLIKPNLALQRLTTREPDQQIIEVGIRAFQAMREAEDEY
jgi:uncharacterized protein YqhQ